MDLIDVQSNPTIATYAKVGEVHVRLTASAADNESAAALLEPVAQEIRRRFGNSIYTEDEKVPLETALVELLKKKKLTIATAESCTGGMVSARLVNVPGASQVFMQGMATYSNGATCWLLGVREETLKEYGAVSEQTAREMAKGGAAAAQTDVCVSITGLAGPGGGSLQKPVGLVFMACCLKGQVTVERWQFKGNREKISGAVCNEGHGSGPPLYFGLCRRNGRALYRKGGGFMSRQKQMFTAACRFSCHRLVLNYFTLCEIRRDEKLHSGNQELFAQFEDLLLRFLKGDLAERQISCFRDKMIGEMEHLTYCVDRLSLHEYAMNRTEPRFVSQEDPQLDSTEKRINWADGVYSSGSGL